MFTWQNLQNIFITLSVEVCANLSILVIFIVPATLISWGQRRNLARFFGISQRINKVKIFVSRLQIQEYGTTGTSDVPIGKGFRHVAITELEYKGALNIQKIFSSRILAFLPQTVKEWVSQQVFHFIDVPIEVCPENYDELSTNANLILIGSSAYNSLTNHYLRNVHSPFYFDLDDREERIIRYRKEKDIAILGRELNRELGIIQRIRHEKEARTVIICAGIGTAATYNCIQYLIMNWKELHRNFGDGNFAVCLAFNDLSRDSKELVPLNRIEIIRTEPSIGTFDSR